MRARPAHAKQDRSGPVVEVTIEEIGAAGDGVARHAEERIFVPFTVPGDRVRARIGARRGAGHQARVVAWLERGPGRVEPACPHFGRCGGCSLQHLAPELYERSKLAGLYGALARAGIDRRLVAPLRRVSPASRRRIHLGLLRSPDGVAQVGLRERFSHVLVDLRHCIILEPAIFGMIDPLRRSVPELLPPGGSAQALLTRTDSGIDLLIEAHEPPSFAALQALTALAKDADLARVTWRSLAADISVVEWRLPRVVLSGVAVAVPPGAFLQASAEAEDLLAAEIAAAVPRDEPTLDLYAGLGVFAFALARDGRRVHAVEGDAASVAAVAAAGAGMPRVSVEHRDLALDPLPPVVLAQWQAAVFDPPRAGAPRQAAALALSPLTTIVAVSCNPATFARDARCLLDGGLRLERVVPIDQFVWTPHLELVAVFRR
jgi:23S rRNA (uracil1939-C5)-methyltransferase